MVMVAPQKGTSNNLAPFWPKRDLHTSVDSGASTLTEEIFAPDGSKSTTTKDVSGSHNASSTFVSFSSAAYQPDQSTLEENLSF